MQLKEVINFLSLRFMLWERGIYANPTNREMLVSSCQQAEVVFQGARYSLVFFPILLSAGLHSKGNFVPTVFVCCCYRITHTTLRWDELRFAQLLRAQTGKGTKSPWPNSHRSLLGFRSELQTCEKGHGVKNSYC